VGIAFLVLARGILGRHPGAVALGIEGGHVDLRLAVHHHLREVVSRAARRGDPEGKALGQPHVPEPRRGPDQRVAIGRVADRAVVIVLQTHRLRRRNAVDHRHVFLLDPFEVEREEVGAETVGHGVFEPRGRALLVRPEDPAAAFLAHIPLGVGIAQDRVLGVRLAPFDQRRVGFGHDILMLHRDRGHLDPQQLRGALRVVAGGGDHVLGLDHDRSSEGTRLPPFSTIFVQVTSQ
jgi:hypothetical protein